MGIRACLDLGGYDPTSTRTETRLSHLYCLTTKTTLYVAVRKFKSIYKSVMQIGHAKKVSVGRHTTIQRSGQWKGHPGLQLYHGKCGRHKSDKGKCGRHKSDKGKCGRAQNQTKASADLQLYAGKSGDGDARGPPPTATTYVRLHTSWSHGVGDLVCTRNDR